MKLLGGKITLYHWLRAFNWVNYVGLVMLLLPLPIMYVMVHLWLLTNDPILYYSSLYVQLGFLMMAWKL